MILRLLIAVVLVGGCDSSTSSTDDLATPADDLAATSDLASTNDLAPTNDLASQPDLAPPDDLSPTPPPYPTSGLVGYWSFDGNANDESGNGNDGTVSGATYTTDRFGHAGSALEFNGSGQVTIANPAHFDLTTFSIVGFISVAAGNSNRLIVTKAPSSSFGNFTYFVNADNAGAAGGKLGYVHDVAAGNWSANASSSAIANDTFVCVAVTMSAAQAKFYVDGTVDVSLATPPAPLTTTAPVVIGNGGLSGTGGNGPFNGVIDDMWIYNRALSDAEVSQICALR